MRKYANNSIVLLILERRKGRRKLSFTMQERKKFIRILVQKHSSNTILWAIPGQVVNPYADSPRRVPRTSSKTSLNSGVIDGSQDYLLAP